MNLNWKEIGIYAGIALVCGVVGNLIALQIKDAMTKAAAEKAAKDPAKKA